MEENVVFDEKKFEQSICKYMHIPLCFEVKDSFNLEKDLGLDSLDREELIMYIEDEFNILINDENSLKIKTISDFKNIVKKLTLEKKK